jgi:hypothetical protein
MFPYVVSRYYRAVSSALRMAAGPGGAEPHRRFLHHDVTHISSMREIPDEEVIVRRKVYKISSLKLRIRHIYIYIYIYIYPIHPSKTMVWNHT